MKKILSHFVCRRGKFTPPYFWVTLLLCLVVVMLVMKLAGATHISDALVLGTLGFVAVWLAVYTWYDKNRPNEYSCAPSWSEKIAPARDSQNTGGMV